MLVFDAPATVKSLKFPESVTTFALFKKHFWSYILKKCCKAATVHIVFDRYLDSSLKNNARKKRGTSDQIDFQNSTVLPKKCHKFLSNSKNKTNPFMYLAENDGSISSDNTDIVITNLTGVIAIEVASHSGTISI